MKSNLLLLLKEFDEDKHPRDEHGRFGSGGGGSGSSESSVNFSHDGEFSKGIAKVDSLIDSTIEDGFGSMVASESVLQTLQSDLAGNAAWDKTAKMYGDEYMDLNHKLVAKLSNAWNDSSGSTPLSVSLQIAAKEEFGLKDSDISHLIEKVGATSENAVLKNAASGLLGLDLPDDQIGGFKESLQAFHRTQYNNTQKFLADNGIKDVYLVRGVKSDTEKAGNVNIKMQPISSFSTSFHAAKSFSKETGSILLVKVPAKDVLSTCLTGIGTSAEREVTVLGNSLTGMRVAAKEAHNLKAALTIAENAK